MDAILEAETVEQLDFKSILPCKGVQHAGD
jgi:hypothetical protein